MCVCGWVCMCEAFLCDGKEAQGGEGGAGMGSDSLLGPQGPWRARSSISSGRYLAKSFSGLYVCI